MDATNGIYTGDNITRPSTKCTMKIYGYNINHANAIIGKQSYFRRWGF